MRVPLGTKRNNKIEMSTSLSTSIESTLDEDQVQYLCREIYCTIHSVDLAGNFRIVF